MSAQLPKSLECPITHALLQDPVILGVTGHTYERQAIEKWLESNNTDPISGEVLENRTLTPNFALREAIEDYVKLRERKQKPEYVHIPLPKDVYGLTTGSKSEKPEFFGKPVDVNTALLLSMVFKGKY